jgi:DNA-binding response OmpR family regulator
MKRILLVDSDPMFTTTLSFLLSKESFQVSVARDGKEATAALSANLFDLVITDMFMPHTNGFELVNAVRNGNESKHTPVMVVSGVTNTQSIDNCFRLGANAYLQKPLNAVALLSEIKNLVSNRKDVAA